jgi:hypothetical protein
VVEVELTVVSLRKLNSWSCKKAVSFPMKNRDWALILFVYLQQAG